MGKAIYQPKGKAKEYSQWACNLYKGCSGNCTYCFMKKGVLGTTWSNPQQLKACFKNEYDAFEVFQRELNRDIDELREHGLHFNFSSDPFLKETIELNMRCLEYCADMGVPTRTLTKQSWWWGFSEFKTFRKVAKNNDFGFTLTGHDELEPGCATNQQRIELMRLLAVTGLNVWASIEPVIDFDSSERMIAQTKNHCTHYKIGLLSGKKFDEAEIRRFINKITIHCSFNDQSESPTIYWKDSLLKQAKVSRKELPSNCVNSEFKI